MILGDVLTKEKLLLKTELTRSSEALKAAFSGKSSYIMVAPYGNRVDVAIEDKNVAFTKHPIRPFSYEEMRGIVRKVQMMEGMKEAVTSGLMAKARKILDAKLTLFYPSLNEPTIEVIFAYNWAFIGLGQDAPGSEVFSGIRDVVKESQGPLVKVLWNNTDIVSLHNYAMNSMSMKKKTFEGLTEVLVGAGLVPENQKSKLASRLTAFASKCAIFMEARQLCQNVDETFDFGKDPSLTAFIGDQAFLKEFSKIYEKLSLTGDVSALSESEITLLYSLFKDTKKINKYSLPENLHTLIEGALSSFSEEIEIAGSRI